MKELNKKVLGIAITVFFLAMLTTPVMAAPTKGQKVVVTLSFSNPIQTIIDERSSGPVIHSLVHYTWDIELAIEDGPTFLGTAFDVRKVVRVPQKDGETRIIHSYYEFSFPSAGGGFEGNTLLILEGFTGPPPPLWDKAKAYSLYQGTGAFEGQTLNFRVSWRPFVLAPAITWTGYLLKP